MITTYRIAQSQYIDDLSGYGAYLYGGRWNLPGTYCLYLASHRSLAYLEFLVHQYDRELWPTDLMIATIEIKDNTLIHELIGEELPINWQSMKYDVQVQQTTTRLFTDMTLGLKVPSVVVPGEFNYLLNPRFHGYEGAINIKDIAPANFDERLKPQNI